MPFVHKGTTNHWLVIYPHSLWKSDLPLKPVSEKELQDMHLMEKRYRDLIYTPGKLSQKQIDKIRRKYDAYKIVYKMVR